MVRNMIIASIVLVLSSLYGGDTLGSWFHWERDVDWNDGDTRDFDRGLNARGRKGARLMGDHIRDHGIKWDALIASPAQRGKTTLEEALPELTPERDRRLYLAGTDTMMDVLHQASSRLCRSCGSSSERR